MFAGLFPATMDQPETAFTFVFLDDFEVHTLVSKSQLTITMLHFESTLMVLFYISSM